MLQSKDILALIDHLENMKILMESGIGIDLAQDLKKIRERVEDDTFRVAVVGEFSSGKSTFINALLGTDLLSHAVGETTVAITRICHVPQNHPKMGRCEITYYSGETAVLDDMNRLAEYTTKQSSRKVEDEIRCVSIYGHFMGTEQPITITDTPGLNGLTRRHGEITLQEVRSAHACIYLLPSKGVTASGRDFLLTLRNYQSCFLFVQNFADNLRAHEGDSIEKLLAADKAAVESIFGQEDGDLRCYYIGISALQALAARDRNIKQLYDGKNQTELTEDDRQRLEKSSGFAGFERCFFEIIASGEYRRIVKESALQAMRTQIKRVLPELEEQNALNQELRSRDAKSNRIEKIDAIIARIQDQQESRERRLRQFIISRDKEIRDALSQYAKLQLEKLCEQTEEDIDNAIRKFDDLTCFSQRWGEEPWPYYNHQINRQINSSLLPDINGREERSLCHLYEETMRQASRYAGRIVVSNGVVTHDVDSEEIRLDLGDGSYEAKQRRLRREEQQLDRESRELAAAIDQNKDRLAAVQEEIEKNRCEQQRAEEEYQQRLRKLGPMPEVEVVQERRTEPRPGLLGKVRDLFGPQIVYVDVEDNSRQEEWRRDFQKYAAYLERRKADCQKKAMKLSEELRELEDCIKKDSWDRDKKSRDAAEKRAELKRNETLYQEILRNRKEEYCGLLKKRLKNAIRDLLLGDDPKSVCALICDNIAQTSLRSLPGIISLSREAFQRASQQQIEELQVIQRGNTAQLDARYAAHSKDIEQLRKILREIEQGEEN